MYFRFPEPLRITERQHHAPDQDGQNLNWRTSLNALQALAAS